MQQFSLAQMRLDALARLLDVTDSTSLVDADNGPTDADYTIELRPDVVDMLESAIGNHPKEIFFAPVRDDNAYEYIYVFDAGDESGLAYLSHVRTKAASAGTLTLLALQPETIRDINENMQQALQETIGRLRGHQLDRQDPAASLTDTIYAIVMQRGDMLQLEQKMQDTAETAGSLQAARASKTPAPHRPSGAPQPDIKPENNH